MNNLKDVILTACGKRVSSNITLNPNAGNVKGAIVTLSNNNGNKSQIYKLTAESTSVIFKAVVPGTYALTVEHEDFFPFKKDELTVNRSMPGYTINLLKNGPATITISSIGDSTDRATVIITNEEKKTLQTTVHGNSATFQRLLPGTLTIEIRFDEYSTFTEQNVSALKVLSGLNVTIYDKSLAVGKKGLAGGTIFYDKGSITDGWRFLEVAPVNTEFNADWNSAINRCKELNLNGFTGWYLPNEDDLHWIYQNLHEKKLGDFGKGTNSDSWKNLHYWSSSQATNRNNYSWYLDFNDGSLHARYMNDAGRVRAIRAF